MQGCTSRIASNIQPKCTHLRNWIEFTESMFLPLPMYCLTCEKMVVSHPCFALPSLLASSQLSLIFLRQTAARAMSNTNRHTAKPTVTHRATGGNATFWPEENGKGRRQRRESLIIHACRAKIRYATVTAVSITIYFTIRQPLIVHVAPRLKQSSTMTMITAFIDSVILLPNISVISALGLTFRAFRGNRTLSLCALH